MLFVLLLGKESTIYHSCGWIASANLVVSIDLVAFGTLAIASWSTARIATTATKYVFPAIHSNDTTSGSGTSRHCH